LVDQGFNVQIPTCNQIEKDKIVIKNKSDINGKCSPETKKLKKGKNEEDQNNQFLTTIQTGNTRLVTKVLYLLIINLI
jgi:hypothetical protein